MSLSYKTITDRIKYYDNEVVELSKGVQGYEESIAVLTATKNLCHNTVLMLKKCRKDGIPFEEFEILVRDNIKE